MNQAQKKDNIQQTLKKILTIKVSGQGFAIAIDSIREIVYHTKISPLPQSPDFMRGVTRIRQETIPVFDLNMLLGDKKLTQIHAESCFITVLLKSEQGKTTQICLLADHILQTYKIDCNTIDEAPAIGDDAIVTYVEGVFRIDDQSFILIDTANLISPYLHEVTHYMSANEKILTDSDEENAADTKTSGIKKTKNKYLSVYSDYGETAFPLSIVYQITNIDNLKKYVDGDIPDFIYSATIINDKPVAIIKLNDFIQSENESLNAKTQDVSTHLREIVILIEYQSGLLGVVVNNIGKTYDLENELTQNALCNDIKRERVKSLGFIDKEDCSVEVIDPASLFLEQENHEVKSWMKCVEGLINISKKTHESKDVVKKDNPYARYAGSYLIVKVGAFLIGLKSADVDEVLSYESLIPVSGAPAWCSGLLDLRQCTHPVIDLHNKLDIDIENEVTDKRNVLVMIRYKNKKIGLAVDTIIQALHIQEKALAGEEESKLFVKPSAILATADCDCGLVHILNIKEIIEKDEISARRLLSELAQANNEPNLYNGNSQ